MTTRDEAREFLGKQVRVHYGYEDDRKLVAEGLLLALNEGGEFVIRDDNGFLSYCWPNLGIELRP